MIGESLAQFYKEPRVVTVITTDTVIMKFGEVKSGEVIHSADLLFKRIWLKNTGATAFNSGKIQGSFNDSDWEDIDTVTFATLAGGAFKSVEISELHPIIRIIATVAAGSTTVEGRVMMVSG